jgi:hypothetical protein
MLRTDLWVSYRFSQRGSTVQILDERILCDYWYTTDRTLVFHDI